MKELSKQVLNDSLNVLSKAIRSIKTNHLLDLETISNQLIHSSTLTEDPITPIISKLIYSIFKLERHSVIKSVPLPLNEIANKLISLHDELGVGKIKVFLEEAKIVSKYLENLGKDIHLYNVFERAGVKKGGKLYDHGLSVARSAERMNVSQWELYPYLGKTKLNDYPEDVDKRVKYRLNYARSLFK